MSSLATLTLLTLCGLTLAQQFPGGALGSYGPVSSTPKPVVYPPAQVHYVNIGEDLTGDYKFGYDTGKNGGGQSFREESRLPDGTVKGAYGYVDAEGKQRIVKYTAGVEGFKVESDEAAPGQGARPAPAAAPAPRSMPTYNPPPPQPQPQPQQVYRAPPASPVNYAPSQPLGGYTPVASQPRYAPQPQPQPQPIAYRPASPMPNYSGALPSNPGTPLSPVSYARQAPGPSSSLPAYAATLAQRQPTLAQVRPSHVASLPRSSSPSLSAYGSSFAGSALQEPQESTTWGPPVINKELLSYNIGISQG